MRLRSTRHKRALLQIARFTCSCSLVLKVDDVRSTRHFCKGAVGKHRRQEKVIELALQRKCDRRVGYRNRIEDGGVVACPLGVGVDVFLREPTCIGLQDVIAKGPVHIQGGEVDGRVFLLTRLAEKAGT